MKRLVLSISLLIAMAFGGYASESPDGIIVQDKVQSKVQYFSLQSVKLLDSEFKHAMELNAEWLYELEPDRLLSNFFLNAGLKPMAESYGGWEQAGIAGHTLGHYLTAVAQQYASTGDIRFKERADYVVKMLDSCQTYFINGFIGGMPGGDRVFKEVKKGIIRSAGFDLNGIWVPWYNEHKTMMGLSDVYLLTGNETAKKVLTNLSYYLWDVVRDLTDDQVQMMLNCEFGGMNEAFAQAYALTGEKKFLDASYIFYHKRLMDSLAERVDVLPGIHSNTQIPKIIGSARQYELTGNLRDEAIAEFFWTTMVHHHSYANGGNSSGEYLGAADHLNDRLTHSTCETCNTYNMLKLSQYLYRWTGDAKYIDYYEKALYNHILASQNHETGMTCYFVPLAMGTHKDFSDKEHSFTCCMGTGFENHSKYGGAIYSHSIDGNALFVDLYIPSELTWKEKGFVLKQETNYPESGKILLTVMEASDETFSINVRYPVWAKKGIAVKVNGKSVKVTTEPGSFVEVSRQWKKGDKISVSVPMDLFTVEIPDNEDRRAIFYGPTLLAGDLGHEEVESVQGVPVFVSKDKQVTKYISAVSSKPLNFVTKGLGYPKDVTLIPFYDIRDQYYTVYWDVFSPSEWAAKQAEYEAERKRLEELDKITVDYISLGEMQPERDHKLWAEDSRVGDFRGKKYRYIYPGGYFAFDMKVPSSGGAKMLMTFFGDDCSGVPFDILVDGKLLKSFAPTGEKDKFGESVLEIPESFIKGKEKIRITFMGYESYGVVTLYDCRIIN